MQYRIKVIEYESGRKEYVPQVRRWFIWLDLWYGKDDIKHALQIIENRKSKSKKKSVTYKPVQP